MLMTELSPVAVAVLSVISGMPRSRVSRIRLLFPDIGVQPVVVGIGVLRYAGERSVVRPDATIEELQLPEGLTIHL